MVRKSGDGLAARVVEDSLLVNFFWKVVEVFFFPKQAFAPFL